MGEVKVYGVWGSPFSRRVEIALKLKGVKYEFIEEDLENKSEQLLAYNPVHKKIPVLVHNDKPLAESLVILEYIDETWGDNNNALLPSDPYDRAQVRFWAKFIDEKIMASVGAALLSKAEDAQKGTQELHEQLKTLENEITKKYFGGDKVGLLDIVGLFVAYWVPIVEEIFGNNNVITRDNFPGIYEWIDQVLNHVDIKDNLPDKAILLPILQARFGANSPPK